MSRRISLLFAILLLLSVSTVHAQDGYGLYGGMTFVNVDGESESGFVAGANGYYKAGERSKLLGIAQWCDSPSYGEIGFFGEAEIFFIELPVYAIVGIGLAASRVKAEDSGDYRFEYGFGAGYQLSPAFSLQVKDIMNEEMNMLQLALLITIDE